MGVIFKCSSFKSRKKSRAVAACAAMLSIYLILSIQETQEELKMVVNLKNITTFLETNNQNTFQRDADDLQTCYHFKKWIPFKNPNTNFELVVPHIEPKLLCEDRFAEVIVVVNSGCGEKRHRILRKAIRKTWANSTALGAHGRFRTFFSLGLCSPSDNKDNELEALENNDIIIGNFTDSYKNVKHKTFMALRWAFNSMFSSSYIVKTDDDIYLNSPRLLQWLYQQNNTDHFYGGFLYTSASVIRDPESPWFISREQFREDEWPPFALGACTVFSTSSIPLYLNYTQYRMPFNTDDAYIGVVARDVGINAVHIPGFKLFVPRDNIIVLKSAIMFGDSIDGRSMKTYFSIFNNITTED